VDFTQDQARSLAGVPVETLRHWRKAIPYLSSKVGKATRFSFSEVVALAVTRELVETFGVHIATLSAAVDAMFSLVTETTPARLESATIAFSAHEARWYDTASQGANLLKQSVIVVPLTPIVSTLQRRILPFAETSRQEALRFPPESVRRQA
jgi:hypothetical protein